MALTLGDGPLSLPTPDARNFEIDGPAHRLLATAFPRRVRARFAGKTVFDTTRGMLVHESRLLPVLYVPDDDVATDLFVASDHTTHCPFKGDATYHSIQVGDRIAEDAVWSYPEPIDTASWLLGHHAFYWDRLDAWFDEDERVYGHLRDPFHRVDVRRSSRRVRVSVHGQMVAASASPLLLSEAGLPNRWYLPRGDVDLGRLTSSTTTTICPYKGEASYWHVTTADGQVDDAAFVYHTPFDAVAAIAGMPCFIPSDDVLVELDGAPLPA